MIVRRALPRPPLAGVVRWYQQREASAGEPMRRIALSARTDVLLEFYFSAPHLLELQPTLARERAPRVAAVGPQTFRRVDLLLSGRMDIFTIQFAPTGLHALLGVPMIELADAGLDATALFGGRLIEELHQRLAEAGDLAARARLADDVLLARLAERAARPTHPAIGAALARIRRPASEPAIGALAARGGLSERQFRRLFEQQVGVSPKLYARIVRFEAALAAKASAPDRRWTDIAHDGGWFDQAHMDKDFRALAGATPSMVAPAARPAPVAVPY